MTHDEFEAFAAPIVIASMDDFKDLRLWPPYVDHEANAISILDSRGVLALVTRHALAIAADPVHVLVTVARAVSPRGDA